MIARHHKTRPIRILVASLLLGLLNACSALDALNASVGPGAYQRIANKNYGPHPRQSLDVYVPNYLSGPADVILFFYGGRWQSGNKRDYRFVAEAFTSKGLITVIPDYRLFPEVAYPVFNQDAAAAYQWVETHIQNFQGNPKRIFIAGHSAGAYLAAMVTLNERLQKSAGIKTPPCGMIGMAGPYDFLPFTDEDIKQVFASADHPIETQPIHYVNGTEAAMLLLYGEADDIVWPHNARNLVDAVHLLGGQATLITYSNVGHASLAASLARPLRHIAPTLKDVTYFIRQTRCISRLEVMPFEYAKRMIFKRMAGSYTGRPFSSFLTAG
ncbi:MAG TPA: alpha/beta hydrolase [Acidiferrobacteraceae bacterium]|nr:alpha/beta hydrolase [Acidiferrobacteraceae bacterium]